MLQIGIRRLLLALVAALVLGGCSTSPLGPDLGTPSASESGEDENGRSTGTIGSGG